MSAEELDRLLGPKAPASQRASIVPRAAWLAGLRHFKLDSAAREIEEREVDAARLLRSTITKADATVGSTTTAGWASQLVETSIGAFFSSITAISAGAKLIEAGAKTPLGNSGSIFIPLSASAPAAVGWIGEGEPVTVWSGSTDTNTLGPVRKAAVITVVTRELLRRSTGAATFETMLRERAAQTIDAAIFSDESGTSTIHPGILAGLIPLTSSGLIDVDLRRLLAQMAAKGGSGNIAICANPREWGSIVVDQPNLSVPVWATRALPVGTLVAVDTSAFASSIGGVEFDVSEEAVVHMAAPASEIVSAAGSVSDPTRSLFQTGGVGIRMIIDVAFTQRGELVSMMNGCDWL